MARKRRTSRRKKTKAAAPAPKHVEETVVEEPALEAQQFQEQMPEPTEAQPDLQQEAPVDSQPHIETVPEPSMMTEPQLETFEFTFDKKERLITTFTAGGVVLSFGLSFGSVLLVPAWPAGGGLLATLGVISCLGAFMARETI